MIKKYAIKTYGSSEFIKKVGWPRFDTSQQAQEFLSNIELKARPFLGWPVDWAIKLRIEQARRHIASGDLTGALPFLRELPYVLAELNKERKFEVAQAKGRTSSKRKRRSKLDLLPEVQQFLNERRKGLANLKKKTPVVNILKKRFDISKPTIWRWIKEGRITIPAE